MSALGSRQRHLARAVAALGLLALAVGLPVAVEFSGVGDALRSSDVLAASGDTVTISDTVTLLPGLPLLLDSGLLQSLNATGVKQGETVDRLRIDRAVFRVPLASGRMNSDAIAKNLQPLVSHLASLNVGNLELRNARVDFKTAAGDVIVVKDITADITPNRRGTYSVKGTANFKEQPIHFDGSWTLPESKGGQPVARVGLKVALKSNNLEASLDGRLGLTDGLKFQGTAELQSRRLRALARWFGLDVPTSTNLRNASVVGPLEWSDGRLTFSKAVVVVDGSEGTGVLSLRTNTGRPAIDGTLAFKVFDAKPHLEAMLASSPPAKRGSAEAAALPAAFDADLRLSAAKVLLPRVETGRGAVTITLKQGRLLAEVPELEIEGGTANGQISLDITGDISRLNVKGRLAGVDPGRVFAADLKRNPLLGRADISVEGSGTGHELVDMIASFSGKGSFTLVDTGRLGLDLKALAYAAQKANRVGWSASGKGSTNFDQLMARYLISNGALSIEALNGRSGDTIFSGSGKIDIRGRLFDLDVAIGAGDGPSAQRDVLVFRGPWADPAISQLGRPFTSTAAPVMNGATAVTPIPGFGGRQ